jgi:hypothetical protein
LKSREGSTTSSAARRVAGQASIAAVETQAAGADVSGVVGVVDEGGAAVVDDGAAPVEGGEVGTAVVDGGVVDGGVVDGRAVLPSDRPPVVPPHPTSRRSAMAGIAAPTRIRLAGVVTLRTLPVTTAQAAAAGAAGRHDHRTAPAASSADSSQILRGADSSQILRGRSGC